ncbi:hypothetical protein N7526_002005 [Penicillium atrosanguineum]|nr:hypothetical protein N7526_002005 [Penicillium atrosanguineum]
MYGESDGNVASTVREQGTFVSNECVKPMNNRNFKLAGTSESLAIDDLRYSTLDSSEIYPQILPAYEDALYHTLTSILVRLIGASMGEFFTSPDDDRYYPDGVPQRLFFCYIKATQNAMVSHTAVDSESDTRAPTFVAP